MSFRHNPLSNVKYKAGKTRQIFSCDSRSDSRISQQGNYFLRGIHFWATGLVDSDPGREVEGCV